MGLGDEPRNGEGVESVSTDAVDAEQPVVKK